ncbi:MAG: polyprenyl synthetase family protein [Flavobacteriales bacterium]|jgi:geranylgeranyl diphosphate synthase type II|nr:polyprenyl synthetase family protein [Flavobacteriales bacterium]
MKKTFVDYIQFYKEQLTQYAFVKQPETLYAPIDYIMNLGGKRIRPCMALLFGEAYGIDKNAVLPLAHSIEIFHNFTLVHDDIMDEAPLRRGKETLHTKWNLNTAILSGDSMMIMAYQELLKLEVNNLKEILNYFNATALKVCEGQQDDMDFEKLEIVSLDAYLEMIKNKTAVLLAASMKLGAMVAKAEESELESIETYGTKIGLAFQLRDDFLDVYGDQEVGKQKAGDILSNKKTALYLYALEQSNEEDRNTLLELYRTHDMNDHKKVETVINIFNKYGIPEYVDGLTSKLLQDSNDLVRKLDIDEHYKEILIALNQSIISRNS